MIYDQMYNSLDVETGLKIGLFGGSFNPPHLGHIQIAEYALQHLKLDRIWWMISPGNPLKDTKDLASLKLRIEESEKLIKNSQIEISIVEFLFKSFCTFKTLSALKEKYPGVHFIWIMGADSLENFHLWKRWKDIIELIPIAVLDRPGFTKTALASPTAQAYSSYRIRIDQAKDLIFMRPPAWTFLYGPKSSLSSTLLRDKKRSCF